MEKLNLILSLFLILILSFACGFNPGTLIIDDFEGPIRGGPQATVDFGAGGGSSVKVCASQDIKFSGNQALKVEYDAASGGYMWVARGYNIDAKGAGCWQIKPEKINWKKFNAISFYMHGENSRRAIAFDIKDSKQEMWRFIVKDDFIGWRQIICPFADFYARGDWQPGDADKNGILDFPVKSFQFEPRPEGRGILYFDCVGLTREE